MTHIVYGIDDKFLPCLLVSMYSVLRTISTPIKFTVIAASLEFDSSSIYKLVEQYPDATVEIQKFDVEKLTDYTRATKSTRYSAATMIPLFVPSLIDAKCIFLDADTLVLQDISVLFQSDMQDCLIGAVPTYTASVYTNYFENQGISKLLFRSRNNRIKEKLQTTADRLGFTMQELTTKYFSAGVIIFDSNAIRNESVFEKLTDMEYSKKYWQFFPDEEHLNYLFKNHVCHLDIKWNVYKDFPRFMWQYFPKEKKTEIISAIRYPSILHFANFYRKRLWKRPWYRARKRYRIYKRICREMDHQTGINIISMFEARQ